MVAVPNASTATAAGNRSWRQSTTSTIDRKATSDSGMPLKKKKDPGAARISTEAMASVRDESVATSGGAQSSSQNPSVKSAESPVKAAPIGPPSSAWAARATSGMPGYQAMKCAGFVGSSGER